MKGPLCQASSFRFYDVGDKVSLGNNNNDRIFAYSNYPIALL